MLASILHAYVIIHRRIVASVSVISTKEDSGMRLSCTQVLRLSRRSITKQQQHGSEIAAFH